jgi:hypothetical protein
MTLAMTTGHSARQVFDLPEPAPLFVTEHRADDCRCRGCGAQTRSSFPDGVNAPAQYGPRIAAFVVYLLHYRPQPPAPSPRRLMSRCVVFTCPLLRPVAAMAYSAARRGGVQRPAAASSLALASTQRAPSGRSSRFQNGACVLR